MRSSRPNFFSIFIAVLVLAGYSEVLRGACSIESPPVPCMAGGSHSHSGADGGDSDGCHCLCHQSFMNEEGAARFEPVLLDVLSLILERADHPPESLPRGIDYPPQLA